MTAYQVYFTLITFGALQPASITFAQLPWLLITIVVGILCGLVINVYLLRDPPPVRLLRTLSRALLIRICALIDGLVPVWRAVKAAAAFHAGSVTSSFW